LNKTSHQDYTRKLINTQVVPSYEDTSLAAVQEYRRLMDNSKNLIPEKFNNNYIPQKYSFISFEGYLNARVMSEILKKIYSSGYIDDIYSSALSLHQIDIGIGTPVVFENGKHQGLNKVYFTTVADGKFIPITSWEDWKK
jgi:hypothetical protein